MYKHVIGRSIAVALFGTLALSAGAQSQMGTTTQQPNATAAPAASDASKNHLYNDYKMEWQKCSAMPMQQQNQCLATVTRQYSTLAPKCQNLTGSAFDNCIKMNDRN